MTQRCSTKKCKGHPLEHVTNVERPKINKKIHLYGCSRHPLLSGERIDFDVIYKAFPKMVIVPSLWQGRKL